MLFYVYVFFFFLGGGLGCLDVRSIVFGYVGVCLVVFGM